MAIARILIVEDEMLIAEDLACSLESLGFEITETATRGEQALRIVEELAPDLILMDIKLKGEIDGIEAAEQILSRFDIPIVYLTAYAEEDLFERAKRTAPYGYIGKPFGAMDLRNTIEVALHKHEADKRVKESEEKYRTLVETAPDGIVEIDAVGRIAAFNSAYCRMLQYDADELTGKSILDLAENDRVAESLGNYLESLVRDHPEPTPWFGRNVTKTGRTIDVQAAWNYKRNSQGNIIGFIAVVTDITEPKKAEEALRKANREWARTFDAVPDPIMILDTNHRIVRANKAMAEGLGVTPQQAIGMTCYEAVHGENAPIASCPHSKLLADGKEHSAEIEEPRLGGVFLVSVSPLHGEDSELVGSVHVARKITGNRLSVHSEE